MEAFLMAKNSLSDRVFKKKKIILVRKNLLYLWKHS